MSSTTCGTGVSTICSRVCCSTLSWEIVFGTSTNCFTISGTGTSRICSTVHCEVRSRLEVLGTSVTCSTTCDNVDVRDPFTDPLRNPLLRNSLDYLDNFFHNQRNKDIHEMWFGQFSSAVCNSSTPHMSVCVTKLCCEVWRCMDTIPWASLEEDVFHVVCVVQLMGGGHLFWECFCPPLVGFQEGSDLARQLALRRGRLS